MAKRTKTAARLGKVKNTTEKTEWKVIEAKSDVVQDLDSDNGSFMYDDTEDFLPPSWTGNSKGKRDNKVEPGLEQSIEVTVTKTAQTKLTLDTTEVESIETSLERNFLQSLTLGSEMCTPVVRATPKTELAQTSKLSEYTPISSGITSAERVTASRPGVSASSVQWTTWQDEQLQELINSLEQKLSITRYQATATRAEQEVRITKQNEKIQSFQLELADKKDLRPQQYLALEQEKEEIEASYRLRRESAEAQNIKVTNELGKLRTAHAELKTKNGILERHLASEKAKVTNARAANDALRDERQRQEFTIRQLQKQVNRGDASLTQLREDLSRTRMEKANLVSEKSSLETELANVRLQSTVTATTKMSSELLEAREAYKVVQRNNKIHQGRCATLKLEISELEHELQVLKDDRASLGEKLDCMRDNLCKANARMNRQDIIIKDLKSEVSDLERDRDLKAPILQIGVDIRLRNLEHARETVLKIPRDEVDGAIIMNGNTAAHRANGAVDAALFQANLVPEDYIEEAEEIFAEMYMVAPSNYGGWSPKVLRLIDYRATIKTVKAFRGRYASLDLREEHSEIESELLKLHDSMAQRAFESSKVVDDLIARLELLTTEIVEVDRSRGGRH